MSVRAGDGFGLPSPGHTTLTRLGPPGSDFAVDSFFDVFYEIDFQGAPGSVLDGMSGTTTATIRMVTGSAPPTCVGGCPAGSDCVETRSVLADGTIVTLAYTLMDLVRPEWGTCCQALVYDQGVYDG